MHVDNFGIRVYYDYVVKKVLLPIILIVCCLFVAYGASTMFLNNHRYIVGVIERREDALEALHYGSLSSSFNDNSDDNAFKTAYYFYKKGYLSKKEIGYHVCPPSVFIYAMLGSEEYLRKKVTVYADEQGEYGDFYRKLLALRKTAVQDAPLYDRVFSDYYALFTENKVPIQYAPIADQKNIARILAYRLREGHPTALDVFFTDVAKIDDEEKGPVLYSFSNGVVICAENGWNGDVINRKGGISPHSGNGVVIFDPIDERYYFYFHMNHTDMYPGTIIKAGTVIGYGGNTGINARKPNKGEHVHIEVFDVRRNDFLTSYEIKALMYDPYFD